MSSNTAETVKKARELMELGVDPMVLMSQMATLIMDIIAGTYQVIEACADSLSTWCTTTLLQLGSVPSADPTPSGSSRRQISRTTEDDPSATF
uniref:Uncharacterized protein n=1 Tax=Lactuca sativa TaxID=4236 RepID=A0A9R1WQY0_LACSA|nr:hypothetical protein LSAT_V11C900490630 [Lactuca sativa]